MELLGKLWLLRLPYGLICEDIECGLSPEEAMDDIWFEVIEDIGIEGK